MMAGAANAANNTSSPKSPASLAAWIADALRTLSNAIKCTRISRSRASNVINAAALSLPNQVFAKFCQVGNAGTSCLASASSISNFRKALPVIS
jgi:hypothetical protein